MSTFPLIENLKKEILFLIQFCMRNIVLYYKSRNQMLVSENIVWFFLWRNNMWVTEWVGAHWVYFIFKEISIR